MTWDVRHHSGPAAALHAIDVGDDGDGSEVRRRILVMHPVAPAVVLGSAQPESVLDHDAVSDRGLEVVRRHSGGGLVLVVPGEMAWLDVVIPATDPLWHDDVGRAFDWLGEAWAAALDPALGDSSGTDRATAPHLAPPQRAELGRVVCFAGIGRGEVIGDGRKLVGLSQRRTRSWARFQCQVHARFDAPATLGVLAPEVRTSEAGERLAAALRDGVGTVPDPAAAVDRLVAYLADL